MNELQFTAQITQWIALTLDAYPSLPFSHAGIEEKQPGSQQRRDITLRDRNKNIVLTGEVKLPYQLEGQSPHNDKVVADARKKARRAGARCFFTWNVNEFLLWETFPPDAEEGGANYRSWQVTNVHRESDFELYQVERDLKDFLKSFLLTFAQILAGKAQIGKKTPDEVFIDSIESYLRQPIQEIYSALFDAYKHKVQKARLDEWMTGALGWTVSDDLEEIKFRLRRAAQFSCYALVNKLVFREALLKRHGSKMKTLRVSEHIETGEELRLLLSGSFAQAVDATGDYETVFGETMHIGDLIPFNSNNAVPLWRSLIAQIHRFDFSKLDYEIIGNIFERLIAPEERKKYGQFYTRVEVVDLINSFCINTGDAKVMDPACGGGTFLVRAYTRKRELMPQQPHAERLRDLFGIDVEQFAAHLSTINLATRDLVGDENYPQVAREDFFSVRRGTTYLSLPTHEGKKPKGKLPRREVQVPPLDAVVGNPPYIRQETLGKEKKQAYQSIVMQEQKVTLSGRSDIHVYFWPHAASFLKEDGYLGLITSSQWLDVEYGFKLQKWILENFRIIAVFESVDEPWFIGARVSTAVTILQKKPGKKERMENIVRFVQLRRPIREVMQHNGSAAEAMMAADDFKDEILALKEETENERYRARLVKQSNLWDEGVKLGDVMRIRNGEDDEEDNGINKAQARDYYGGKWGVHLRAPDIWFEMLNGFGDRLVPLGEIAAVQRGVTSGNDDFFYPIDCSADMLAKVQDEKEFRERFRAPRSLVKEGVVKVVRCGPGHNQVLPIESKYLEPEVHSLMEIKGFAVKPKECSRLILLTPTQKQRSKMDKYLRKYIEWGENQGLSASSTCKGRVTEERDWYDLVEHERAAVLWPKERQYRHIAPANPEGIVANCRLYEIYPKQEESDVSLWAGLLNSSFSLLSSLQYGRPMGNEGNWSTMVVDANMMLVPDPRKATKTQQQRVARAFQKMAKRDAYQFISEKRLRREAYVQAGTQSKLESLSDKCELDMPDRRELDDAVLQMMGVSDKAKRNELINRLYAYLHGFFEDVRQKEERAIENKKRAAKRSKKSPTDLAKEVYDDIDLNYRWLLKKYEDHFLDPITEEIDIKVLPKGIVPSGPEQILNGYRLVYSAGRGRGAEYIEVPFEAQAKLLKLLSEQGFSSYVRYPHYEEDAKRLWSDFSEHVSKKTAKLTELVTERTHDEERQEKILAALLTLLPR